MCGCVSVTICIIKSSSKKVSIHYSILKLTLLFSSWFLALFTLIYSSIVFAAHKWACIGTVITYYILTFAYTYTPRALPVAPRSLAFLHITKFRCIHTMPYVKVYYNVIVIHHKYTCAFIICIDVFLTCSMRF